jgi:histo-blood group ABO system transferase
MNIPNKPTIGILLISTWKYNKFINDTISGIRKYFFKKSNVKIFLHTDSSDKHDADIIIPHSHQPWPFITLNRFNTFHTNQDIYNTDYIFYLDIDTKIINDVDENILSDFTAVAHHWHIHSRGTPETNPSSTAFIDRSEPLIYVCGGFFGGTKTRFIQVAELLDNNIKIDLTNNIIAVWHDESHLNRYCASNKDSIKILSPEYMYWPSNKKNILENPKMIPFLDREKKFNKFENKIA